MRIKLPAVIIALVVIMFAAGGCYYDNEETLYPSNGCDTADVKYSTHVSQIISSKCFQCHDNANAPVNGNGFSWEGYPNISGYLATSAHVFMSSIKHEIGFTPMPENNPKLSDCEIRTIEIWIQDGFPNN
jgi:hypothetical protein